MSRIVVENTERTLIRANLQKNISSIEHHGLIPILLWQDRTYPYENLGVGCCLLAHVEIKHVSRL